MGLILFLVIGGGIYLYYRRKRTIRELVELYGRKGIKGAGIFPGKCNKCGFPVSTRAKSCPHCGKSNPTRNIVLDTVLGILVVYFIVTIVSEFTDDRNSSAQPGKEIFETGVVEDKSTYIPELNPDDVYLSLEDIGFTTEKIAGSDTGNIWTSRLQKDGIEYRVDISSDDILRVQSIQGTATHFNRNPAETVQFFKYTASSLFLHNNGNETELNNWIEKNFNNDNAVNSVGKVTVKISAPSDEMRQITMGTNIEEEK